MPQKKNVRQGAIELDYDEVALVINYELEVVYVDESGREIEVLERTPETRRVKIKSLTPEKNLAQLAADIIEKCKYVHPSRVEEVEKLLNKLRRHVLSGSSSQQIPEESKQSERKKVPPPIDDEEEEEEQDEDLPPANIAEIDDYMDMLYQVSGKSERERQETIRVQVRGTGMILQLCRDVMNLEVLIQNSTVMGALTRVLQEEHKKSAHLTFNIMRIFLAFSNFMEMHGLLANYRVGVLTMKAIDLEVKRFEHRAEENKARTKRWEAQVAKVQSERSGSERDRSLEKMAKQRAREEKKIQLNMLKQGKVLFVEFYVLFNLAEDVTVERKMVKKGLVGLLNCMLQHNHGDLLILVRSATYYHRLISI